MAENKRSMITPDTRPWHINLAAIKKRGPISKNNSGMQSPMASDRNYNASEGIETGDRLPVLVDTARMQLISPPPEEMLRKTPRLSAQFTPSLAADTGASPVNPSIHGSTAAKRKRPRPTPTSSTTSSYSRDMNSMNQDIDLSIQSPQPMEATPNPKPRKQGRLYSRQPSFESPTRTSFGYLGSSPISNDDTSRQYTPSRSKSKKVLLKSPHAKNPNADFIDETPLVLPALKRLGARSSRRSATPIPPYEPPTDVFTPPREVFLSPVTNLKSMSRSSRRKISGSKSAKGKKKGSKLTIVTAVKQELPDIDLTLPMPPPSPTDDPLLLLGPAEPDFLLELTPRRREMEDLPPSSPEPPLAVDDEEAVRIFNWNRNENAAPEASMDESIMHLDPDDAGISPVRLFDFNGVLPSSNGGWTDSEREPTVAMEEIEGEGEYTGHWKMMIVRTKQDPPSSATRVRMEEWGRPISPFPMKLARIESVICEEEEEEEVRRMSVEPEELWEKVNEEEQVVRPPSVAFDGNEDLREEEEVKRMSVEPEELCEKDNEKESEGQEFRRLSDFDNNNEELREEEQVGVRRLSVEPEGLWERDNEEESEEQEIRQLSVELDANNEEQEEVRRLSGGPEELCERETEQQVRREFGDDNEEQEDVRQLSVEPEELWGNEEESEEQEVRQLSVEFDDDNEELASPSGNPNLVPENSFCGNPVSIPALEPRRQPSPAAVELVKFPSIGLPDSPPEPILDLPYRAQLEYRTTPSAPPNELWTQTSVHSEEEEDDDDQSSDDSDELRLVKITSANPRAAARAAAILKQHDYDCYTSIEVKRRHLEAKRRRKSDIEDFAKESRRRDVFSSGVAKGSNSRRRRSTLSMGVIGDRAFIPGSPAITLPELLQEAELEVMDGPQGLSQRLSVLPGRGDPFQTPMATKYRAQTVGTRMADQRTEVCGGDMGEREWTKEDWKHLDACFTDQRLEVGSRLAGAEESLLAPVNMVSIDDIVDNFVVSKGGPETVARFGALWSRENLLERTRALQKKQRSGHIAPPTTPYTPSSVGSNGNVLGGKERAPRMEVPDFTPLRRRAAPPRKSQPTVPQPVTHNITCNDSTPDQGPLIPPTLLAPRYSHLLEEAIAVSQQGSPLPEAQDSIPQYQYQVDDKSHSSDIPSTTIGKRVKGFLFSYLPTLPKSSSTARKGPVSLQPSLPIPPIEILSKERGPVVTPARAPLLKPKHPKELVVLHPAPQPPTVSNIPRLKKPQRLVELRPPVPPMAEPTPIPRPRRSSGSSVKDLVRGFEEIQALSCDKSKLNQGWKKYADKRPRWKP